MKELIRFFEKELMRTLLFPFRLLTLKKNRIVLFNDLSKTYADNPKSIATYLIENFHEQFEIIFPVKDVEKETKKNDVNVNFVKYMSFRYFYFAMTSSVFVTNSGGFSFIPMRTSQLVINTFHGGGAYKKCGIQMYEDSYLFRRDLLLSSKTTDIFLSSCRRFSEVMSSDMLVDRSKFLEIGMPRNDCLINLDLERRKEIRNKIGIKEEERLVLFAPTYRKLNDNYYLSSVAINYGLDNQIVTRTLKEKFGEEWKFGYRFHPTINNANEYSYANAIDLSDYDDMQELLMATDVLITDFSSCMWDFMLTNKPVFIFAKDLKHYIETTEVYTPVEEWPFPKSTTNEELCNNIANFDYEDYKIKCKNHYESLGGCETGKATEIICERICEFVGVE